MSVKCSCHGSQVRKNMIQVNASGVSIFCRLCETRNRVPFHKLHRRGQCASCGSILPYVTRVLYFQWEEEFWSAVKRASTPLLVAFVERAGGDPSLEATLKVVASCGGGEFAVGLIELERNPLLTQELGIRQRPFFILYKAGVDMGHLTKPLDATGFELYLRSALSSDLERGVLEPCAEIGEDILDTLDADRETY